MARVPTSENVAQVGSIGVGSVPSIPAQAFSGSARSLQQLAQVAGKATVRFRQARAASQLTTATVAASSALKQAELDFEQDPDFDTAEERFEQRAEEIRAQVAQNITEDAALQAFDAEFARSRAAIGVNVRRDARKRFVDQSTAQLFEDTNRLADLFARSVNKVEQDDLFQKAIDGIDDAAETGIITQTEAAKRKQIFRSRIDANLARKILIEDPEAAELQLAEPGGPFPNLDETTRLSLLDRAQRRALAVRAERIRQVEKADKAQEDALKAAQEAREISLIPEALAGTIDTARLLDELETRKISREAFVRLRGLAEAEQNIDDDPEVLLSLTRDVADADPSAPGRIAQAVQGRLLSAETASGLFNRFDSARQRGGVLARSDVRRARAFVDQIVGGVRGPLATLDTADSARVQRALREFDDRVLAAEQAGEPINAKTIADEVVEQFRLTPPQPNEFPKPRFLVGSRAQPDIAATRLKTLEALDAGQITKEQAERELRNLEQIEDALQ